MKTWLKKHRITTTEAAELLGMKGPQQVRNKLAGADAITEKDVLLLGLWNGYYLSVKGKKQKRRKRWNLE